MLFFFAQNPKYSYNGIGGVIRQLYDDTRILKMDIVILTALGVGGATMIGALIGFVFGELSQKVSGAVLGFAAGVMLSAAFTGLIMPSLLEGGKFAVLISSLGIISGAVCLDLIDRLIPHGGGECHSCTESERKRRVLLFVLAIAIHNIPEGIAAGVGFGLGNTADALLIAGAIALQNLPEGMVIIAPMLSAGISKGKTILIALATGLVEVIGTFVGYFAVGISNGLLPFLLAFAGGTMLYVVCDEMIPETHRGGDGRTASYATLVGFVLMLAFSELL